MGPAESGEDVAEVTKALSPGLTSLRLEPCSQRKAFSTTSSNSSRPADHVWACLHAVRSQVPGEPPKPVEAGHPLSLLTVHSQLTVLWTASRSKVPGQPGNSIR
jgi:hypothetical protein